jgi:hypothetical protein
MKKSCTAQRSSGIVKNNRVKDTRKPGFYPSLSNSILEFFGYDQQGKEVDLLTDFF